MMIPFEEAAARFPANWQAQLSELYTNGGWDTEARALVAQWLGSCTPEHWQRWEKDSPAFAAFLDTCRLLSRAWWERQGREHLTTSSFKYPGWILVMKHRFGWGEDDVQDDQRPEFTVRVVQSEEVPMD